MPIPIAIAVVEHDGRFLIGQRPAGVPLAGLWEFPGGKIQPGETPEAAAVRECLEETGLSVEPLFCYPTYVHQYKHGSVELRFIACRPFGPSPRTLTSTFRWVSRDELLRYEFPEGNLGLLQQIAAAQIPSR
jgi:8-oxo-dGTP diphosphatase